MGASLVAHLMVVLALLAVRPHPPATPEPPPVLVQLVAPFRPPEPPQRPQAQPAAAVHAPNPAPRPARAPARTASRPAAAHRAPAPAAVVPLPAGNGPMAAADDGAGTELGEGDLAGAATAGSGAPGSCDMAAHLQRALRRDRRVQAALAEAHRGKALLVWNGDWVRHGGQEGLGLAAVREAVMWEVAFAPAGCRAQPVRGLVLISLADGPGAPRIVVGSGQWRWSDLLFAPGAGPSRRR